MGTRTFRAYARSLIMMFAAPPVLLSVGLLIPANSNSQDVSNFERERGRMMLDMVKTEIKKNYYDPGFHGMDLDARFKAADEKIRSAASLGQVFGIIAQAMTDLGDSHTFFIPPNRAYRTEYGWQMQMIGDVCYVVAAARCQLCTLYFCRVINVPPSFMWATVSTILRIWAI